MTAILEETQVSAVLVTASLAMEMLNEVELDFLVVEEELDFLVVVAVAVVVPASARMQEQALLTPIAEAMP